MAFWTRAQIALVQNVMVLAVSVMPRGTQNVMMLTIAVVP
jgi:hypothetical protein